MIMKRYSIFILAAVLFFSIPTAGWAGRKSTLSGVDRQTLFNNVTDSLATLGKSPQQKSAIKKMRHAARRKARLEKLREENHQRIIRR